VVTLPDKLDLIIATQDNSTSSRPWERGEINGLVMELPQEWIWIEGFGPRGAWAENCRKKNGG